MIEAPRSRLREIFDPHRNFVFMVANPAASRGVSARGDSTICIELIIYS
jgi:hypothetical protein